MQKLAPPPYPADQTQIETVLRRLYRRRLVVRRLIRSLEAYSQLDRGHNGAATVLVEQTAGRHVH